MDYNLVSEQINYVRIKGEIPINISMNVNEYRKMRDWAERSFTMVKDENYKDMTPTYLGIPIITEEDIADGEIWVKSSRYLLNTNVVELGER